MIIYPFVCIPEGYLIDNYSTRLGIIIAAGTTLLGSGLKMLVNKDTSLACCFVGQFFSGLFQPALLNSPGKIAANWFREDIRTVICTICCLADTVGIFVGFLWNMAFIDEDAPRDEYRDQVFNYILSEFILNVVFCLPAFFIFKDKPDIPPSPSQSDDNSKKIGLVQSLKMLFTNIRFIYLLIATLFVVGYYDVMGTIINSLFEMYGITGNESNIIYAVSSVAGMLASLLISWLLDKYKKFKLFMVILCISGTVLQALFTFLMELAKSKDFSAYAVALVLYTLVNIIVVPFYTIGMNYACEITYPVGESINGGIMMTMSQLSGIGGTFLCDHFINHNEDKPWISNVILLGFFAISCIFVFLFDEKLNRQEVDKAGRENEDVKKNDQIITVEVAKK
jgi:Na+/melibiose symporter-like transporter